jgi:hypothetical protein
LHTARRRGLPTTEDAPEDRRRFPADEAVENAAPFLRLDEFHVEFARVVQCFANRVRRDLVEDHALHGNLRLQHFQHVPADRFPLAILIGGDDEFVGLLQRLLQLGDDVLLVAVYDVHDVEVIVGVDTREPAVRFLLRVRHFVLASGQVADVTDAGLDREVATQIARDGLGLGR